MKYFFTADCHLGHANIIKYCGRPFNNVRHMNKEIIRRWNERVSQEDIVFHNGDFCFKNSKGGKKGEGLTNKATYYEKKLNGRKVHILGNHDKNNSVRSVVVSMTVRYGPHYIYMVHDPKNYDDRYGINFVGHVHEKWKFKRVVNPMDDTYTDLINVGVDQWNFYPVTFEEIYRDYKRWAKHAKKSY